MTSSLSPAAIIAQSLGGQGRLRTMLGARDIYSDNGGNTLSFKIGVGALKRIKHIAITLTPDDTYTVIFTAMGKRKDPQMGISVDYAKEVAKVDGVYNDNLGTVIETATGLRLSL